MMHKISLSPRSEAHLAGYRLPELRFTETKLPYSSLEPVWIELRNRNFSDARELILEALDARRTMRPSERSALKATLAVTEIRNGAIEAARRHAGQSLDLHPNQYMAHRVLLSVLTLRKGFAAAYLHLLNLQTAKRTPSWDETLSFTDIQTALAAWSWQLGEWDQVADHLLHAWPKGLSEMPPEIREDWFRLSLYRGHPEDAAEAAAMLIDQTAVESADELLQTIVQSGWTKQALPLYRIAYEQRPKSELLRRRLVALCIREGELEEARRLTTVGALRLAA